MDQMQLPWGDTRRVRCERCQGIGTVWRGRGTVHPTVILGGIRVECPECNGVGTVVAPVNCAKTAT